jgi:hypothetical protein
MARHALVALGFLLAWPALAAAQNPVTADSPFQMRAVAGLKAKDAVLVSNSAVTGGPVCANAYAMDATTGYVLDCCSCVVGPTSLRSISIASDLLQNQKPRPRAAVLLLIGSTPGGNTQCDAGAPGALQTGMTAWIRETPFTPATLGAGLLSNTTVVCAALHPARTCAACAGP